MPDAPDDYRAALKANDRHYEWKMAFRLLLLLVDAAMIGMAGWATSQALTQYNSQYGDYDYYAWDLEFVPWVLIPMGLSFIYAIVVLVYQLARTKPVHPGWNVGVDLILWIAFAILASLLLLSALDNVYRNNSDSYYYRYKGSDTDCSNSGFTSCAERDASVNSIYHRGVVEVAIFALMLVAV